jgi:hypothetical protein
MDSEKFEERQNQAVSAGPPPQIPVRMLNEFTYCPRLGYLMWVDSEWADSHHTVEGRWRHKWDDELVALTLRQIEGFRSRVRVTVRMSAATHGPLHVVTWRDLDGIGDSRRTA